jgi:hypothetical protein
MPPSWMRVLIVSCDADVDAATPEQLRRPF